MSDAMTSGKVLEKSSSYEVNIKKLGESISFLNDKINGLNNKLKPVLLPETCEQAGTCKDAELRTELDQFLVSSTAVVQLCYKRIDSMISRCCL